MTEFLGYRANNGEGKVMGLAPYGSLNESIISTMFDYIQTGADYNVKNLTQGDIESRVSRLEEIFNKGRKNEPTNFTDWHQDLAFVTQKITEDIVKDIIEKYINKTKMTNVCLAGGVALNCKMNKEVMQHPDVSDVFIQPVANDAGLAIGAGMLEYSPQEISPMETVYYGPEYDNSEIKSILDEAKIDYHNPDSLPETVAREIADGKLVGWYQGRMEMGPRALGNRSILADPRSKESRDRVNKYVKHRETWRPFAPSMLEKAADEYLTNEKKSPYMIKTFDTNDEKRDDISAAIHPGDGTTRPQTVTKRQNPRYHELLTEFEEITGVPVLVNTSFNDHGEPIVNTQKRI